MNHVLRDCLGKFVVVYFDDILIYRHSFKVHLGHLRVGHLRVVLSLLQDHQLYANIDKCIFCVESVIFLGFVVNKSGVHVMSSNFCPHLIFKFGDLIEFSVFKD